MGFIKMTAKIYFRHCFYYCFKIFIYKVLSINIARYKTFEVFLNYKVKKRKLYIYLQRSPIIIIKRHKYLNLTLFKANN